MKVCKCRKKLENRRHAQGNLQWKTLMDMSNFSDLNGTWLLWRLTYIHLSAFRLTQVFRRHLPICTWKVFSKICHICSSRFIKIYHHQCLWPASHQLWALLSRTETRESTSSSSHCLCSWLSPLSLSSLQLYFPLLYSSPSLFYLPSLFCSSLFSPLLSITYIFLHSLTSELLSELQGLHYPSHSSLCRMLNSDWTDYILCLSTRLMPTY